MSVAYLRCYSDTEPVNTIQRTHGKVTVVSVSNKLIAKMELDSAIAKLPNEYRAIVTLYFIDGMPIKEVAALLGLQLYQVYRFRGRAVKILKGILDNAC